jgi:2-dehydro-3-deoxygalactonokinase
LTHAFRVLVDWGTTSFRLWVVDRDGKILGESRGREGMLHAATAGFASVLDHHLRQAGVSEPLPVVICGMAGARQGWVEAAYLPTPTPLNDLGARATIVPGRNADTRILPGLSQGDPAMPSVMRGEETQLLGLGIARGEALVCMPGTHCKWVELADGVVTRFSTFMTGEMFDVLATHSILKHAVDETTPDMQEDESFLSSVRKGFETPETAWAQIFALRASQLLGMAPKQDGRNALSGLLIGAEIGGALRLHPMRARLVLVASGHLAELYTAALKTVGLRPEWHDAEDATRKGLLAAARSLT